VKRILLDNELVVNCGRDLINVSVNKSKEFKRALKKNAGAVRMLFDCGTKFLMRQMDAERMVRTAVNLAAMYAERPKEAAKILRYLPVYCQHDHL
jgi:hypothetical protein